VSTSIAQAMLIINKIEIMYLKILITTIKLPLSSLHYAAMTPRRTGKGYPAPLGAIPGKPKLRQAANQWRRWT
jgi:hypothetical protein